MNPINAAALVLLIVVTGAAVCLVGMIAAAHDHELQRREHERRHGRRRM